jgi:hypothetical protein
VAQILLGFGDGINGTPALNAALSGVAAEDTGVTSAMSSTSNQIGASIGIALLSTIAASATASSAAIHGRPGGSAAAAIVHGFTTATAWGAVVLVAGALLVGLLVNTDPGREPALTRAGRP